MNKIKQKTTEVVPVTPWRFIYFVAKVHKKWAILAIVSVVLAAVISSGSSYFFKLIIDAVEVNDLKSAMFWGLLYPVVIFIYQVTYRVSGYAGAHWENGSNKVAFDTLTKYLLKHSHGFFIDRFAGSITSKLRNVTGAFENIIPDFLWAHLNSLVSFLVIFVLILLVDVKSALTFIALLVALIFVNKKFAPGKVLTSRASAEAGTLLQGRTVDVLTNISTVRQYVKRDYELQQLQALTTNKAKKGLANWLYTEKLLLINTTVLFIFALGMFWQLVNQWGQGAISTGDFVLVLALVSNITVNLIFVGRAFNATARTIGELREGLDDILLPYEIVDLEDAKTIAVSAGVIRWKQVNFSFGESVVFKNLDLNIPAKQRLGLVGTSGAGKSTFVSLLLRQHEIMSGNILIDEQDIYKVTQDSLREALSVVPQEPALFHRTIRENIAYGKPNATFEEIVEIAKKAQAHNFIEKLPNGYDTLVGERGIKLSGGQKQRVAIARAMLKNSPILILDEATSALDSESEIEIQKALHLLMEGKTVIAIAHRLSTLREMDRIILLENGEILEDGTHDSLLAKTGLYAKLWQHQAGGFLLE